ncbi:ATP-binding protein [candidate division KSB1 bacterium]|nr:ATP-binding protein [candidate division KSB1 bacterium]
MTKMIEMKIPAEARFLKIIRIGVGYTCELIGFSSEDQNNITLAVDEACSNIVKYAYDQSPSDIIHMTCRLYNDRIEFTLRDFGKKVNESTIKSRSLDDIRPGGLGVHLIKSVMDEVFYDTNVKIGNKLKLVKYLTHKGNTC